MFVILLLLFIGCAPYIYEVPTYISDTDRDLLNNEDCVCLMWNDQLVKHTIKAVSIKKMSNGKLRVIPKNGEVIYCDDYMPLGDVTLCQ